MDYDIIMPVLGMNQDTGTIAKWHKNSGDFVNEGEVLLSVETDKAVQEIESLHKGYLCNVQFGEGDCVPVGKVVACLSETQVTDSNDQKGSLDESSKVDADDKNSQVLKNADSAKNSFVDDKQETNKQLVAKQEHSPETKLKSVGTSNFTGKILASPKAKQLAAERSIKLVELVKSGIQQPIHYLDVFNFKPLSNEGFSKYSEIKFSVDPALFNDLQQQLTAVDSKVDRKTLLMSFIAGAARFTGLFTGAVEVMDEMNQVSCVDPDLCGVSSIKLNENGQGSSISFWDFTDSLIESFSPQDNTTVNITFCGQTKWTIAVRYDMEKFSSKALLAFVQELAKRLAQPLRQIL